MASPFEIGGQINFAPAGIGNPIAGAAAGTAGLADAYGKSYQSALEANQQNYQNILAGYQKTIKDQQSAQAGITQGYKTLQTQVANTLGQGGGWGVAAPAADAISRLYAQTSGQGTQQLINSGLGNTTMQQDYQRRIAQDTGKQYRDLGLQLADRYASSQQQIGLAGLGYQGQANQENSQLAGKQLDFMNSVQIPYPDTAAYNQLFTQLGNWNQAAADRGLLAQQAAQQFALQAGAFGGGAFGQKGGGTFAAAPGGAAGISYGPNSGTFRPGGGMTAGGGGGRSGGGNYVRPGTPGTGASTFIPQFPGAGANVGGTANTVVGAGISDPWGYEFLPGDLPSQFEGDQGYAYGTGTGQFDPWGNEFLTGDLAGYGGGGGGGGFDVGALAGLDFSGLF